MEESFVPYTTEDLVNRVYQAMEKEGTLFTSKKMRIPVPISCKRKNRKTIVSLFVKLCHKLNRDPELVSKYISDELTAVTSVNDEGELKISGSFQTPRVMGVIVHYIKNYVQCSICHRDTTEVIVVHGTKQLKCSGCGAINLVD